MCCLELHVCGVPLCPFVSQATQSCYAKLGADKAATAYMVSKINCLVIDRVDGTFAY